MMRRYRLRIPVEGLVRGKQQWAEGGYNRRCPKGYETEVALLDAMTEGVEVKAFGSSHTLPGVGRVSITPNCRFYTLDRKEN